MAKKKILVVDDEESIAILMKNRLAAQGYDVTTAADGAEGFEKFITEKPDLLITDVLMPKMTGYQLVEKIKSIESPQRNTPILVISAKNTMRDHFQDYAVTEFISKIYEPAELIGKVKAMIGESQAGVPGDQMRKADPGTAMKPSARGQGYKVLLTGCKPFILEKVKEYLEGKGAGVIVCVHEEEAIEEAMRVLPALIVCQYWDDPHTFDAVKIYENLRNGLETRGIPFVVFLEDIRSVYLEAMKTFPQKNIISYKESPDITRKLEDWVKVT